MITNEIKRKHRINTLKATTAVPNWNGFFLFNPTNKDVALVVSLADNDVF